MEGNVADFNHNSGNNDDDDATDLPQADSPYTQFLDAEKRKNYTRKKKRCLTIGVVVFITIFVSIFIIAAVLLAYSRSAKSNQSNNVADGNEAISVDQQICDDPPIIHVSLDGYRADYYERMLNPNLQFIIDTGVRADYMRSQYPTQTFPNHYTIMTGLYPEYHGIVANAFYNKDTNEMFRISLSTSTEPQWWFGEPVWVTAKKNGLITGVYFWPGSEVPGIQPDYYFNYSGSVPYRTRVNTVLGWLDLPRNKRPQFIALYFNQPDHTGHQFGPDSSEVNESIQTVDTTLGWLIDGLRERNISNCVNLIVTSDHGMQSGSENRTLYLEDYVGNLTDEIQVSSLGVVVQFIINSPADKVSFYNKLTNLPHVQVFYQEDVPYRLRIGHNSKNRYGDIVVIPDTGWFVTARSPQYSYARVIKGLHGYDNNARTMRAFMAARGPAFKENYVSSSFDNIQLYNLECALLGISPATNNGTFGALYNLLKPDIVEKLPKEQSFESVNSDSTKSCQFPVDIVTLSDRLDCSDCLCSSCQLNSSMLLEAALQLNLTLEQISYYQSYHIIGGVPQGGGGSGSCLLIDQQKINKYSTTLHIPLWVAYRLDGNNLTIRSQSVTNCSRMDPRVSESESAKCADFNVPNYVRGTLANFNSVSGQYFTSQIPQLYSFYQDIWQVLQGKLLNWAVAYSSIHVISGSILDSDHNGLRDNDEDYNRWTGDTRSVAIPTQFYAIVIRCNNKSVDINSCAIEDIQALGIVMYHEESDKRVTQDFFEFRITSVREIEKITDINFFPELTASQQNKIELEIITDLWDHTYNCIHTCSDCSFPTDPLIVEERTRCSGCICPYCQVNRTYLMESNKVFNISQLEVFNYLSHHLPWGVPQGSDDSEACVLTHSYYIIKYSTFYHIPLWVAYKLNGSDLTSHFDRKDCFRRDPRIPITDSSNCSDYSHSGFDRGHLAPNGDFNYNRFAQLSTFVLTNIAPQYHALNAGAWLVAENKVREWARTYSVIYVISGSILGESRRDQHGNYDWWIGGYGHAAVPTHFYKILSRCNSSFILDVLDCPIDQLETLTFLFEHVNSGTPSGKGETALLQALTTIRNIEALTGMDFFTQLTMEDQDKIELKKATALWE